MKLLVLGGTAFLGRHVVAEALGAGHQVTTFTRGQTNPGLIPDAEEGSGDQDDLAVGVPLLELGERVSDTLKRVGRGNRDLDLP